MVGSAAETGPAEDRPTGPVPQGAPSEGAPPNGGPAPSGAAPTGHPPTSAAGDGFSAPVRAEEKEEDQNQGPRPDDAGPAVGADPVTDSVEPDVDHDGEVVEADLARLVDDVERLQGEREELLDQLLRARADFENYRKRMIRQQAEQAERAAEDLVGKLLEVLDVFDAAKTHGQGFEQACTRLSEVLGKEGLVRIDPAGSPFDPTVADAVAHEPASEEPGAATEPTVSDVLRAGYRWKGRVLRPAMVKVRG